MTYHLRHHTTQAHIKAAKCVPAFTLRNELYPEHYEAAYAKAMRALVTRETEGRPTGIISEQRMNKKLRDERVLSVMKDGRCRTLDDVSASWALTASRSERTYAILCRLKRRRASYRRHAFLTESRISRSGPYPANPTSPARTG